MAKVGRTVRIKRRKKMSNTSDTPPVNYVQAMIAASYGRGTDTQQRTLYCLWCSNPKEHTKASCRYCGRYGTTDIPQERKSQVYIETE